MVKIILAAVIVFDIPNLWHSLWFAFLGQHAVVFGSTLKNVKTDRSHKPGYPRIIS